MSAGTPSLPDPYKVEAGDTLSRIAEASGLPVSELGRLNELEASSRLTVGQALYLSPRTANGVTVQFLDALRHPISNLAYRLKFDDRSISGVTDQQGITAQQITQSPSSLCEISIQGADGRWRPCARTVSGVGHKFITLVSSALVVKGSTDRHPAGAPVQLGIEAAPGGQSAQKARPGEPSGQPSRNNPVVLTRKNKGPHGQSIIRIDVAFPPGLLDLFAGYTGGEISPAQWDEAAEELECETAVLKAFAEVESGSRAAFWRLNRGDGAVLPAILYERHYFSRLTARRYDHTHPDLSWRVGYRTRARLGKSDRRMHDGRVDANDIYANYA
ncbi:MAG: LysM peptidoglycan-binding domain-containing protein, partial [Rhodocyclaceae bacterium]|nr:LysM peptidoglycan-binding domain-containing protein [Rhodocyclaceae bacterium]